MAKDRILTMADLISYFSSNNIQTFSNKQSGKPIVVQAIQDFSNIKSSRTENNKLYAPIRVCHIDLNRNGSFISEENMKKAMPTLKDSPLLGYIHKLDSGEYDFHSHNMHIEEDSDGNEQLIYDEKQIGSFTASDPYLEYDEEMDKTYVVAEVAIPEEYTMAADIIRRKNGTKVSCELSINECSYNAKEKYLNITDFVFMGCTCLGSEVDGTPIGEGMLGSKITLEDFSAENNSLVKFASQLEDVSEKIDSLLSHLDIDNSTEGGKFEVENNGIMEETEISEVEETTEEVVEVVSDEAEEITPDVEVENFVKTFEISHDDIRYALYSLLAPYEESDNEWYYINSVYDSYFVYESWDGSKLFGQNYTKENDEVSFEGERYELFKEILTASEKAELDSMRANYAYLVEFKDTTEKNELHAQRNSIMCDEKYSIISGKNNNGEFENSSYAKLYEEMDNYSCEELAEKLKAIIGEFAIQNNKFSHATSEKEEMKKFANVNKAKKTSRYGNLFSK